MSEGRRDLVRAVVVLVVATLWGALGGAVPAHAGGQYFVQPGHDIYFENGGGSAGGSYGACTAGYAVAGRDGTFVLSSSDCRTIDWAVRGRTRAFGFVAASASASLLIRTSLPAAWGIPPDDAVQVVVDPRSGRSPGTGRIESYVPTSEQTPGTAVAWMGAVTGWTEGYVTGWIPWQGRTAICVSRTAGVGDAGAPVWRWDHHGLRAVGIVVATNRTTGGGCYLPIEDLLVQWGAWLPVFPTVFPSGRAYPGVPRLSPAVPRLDPTGFVAATKQIPAFS